MSWLDLHMHSNYSTDGEFTPKELIELCSLSGVTTAALADHNTASGVKEASLWAEKKDITLVPAIELDTEYENKIFHVLGYWIDADFPEFEKLDKEIAVQELEASEKKIKLIQQLGIPFPTSSALKLSKNGIVTGEMIAEAALSQAENKNNSLLLPYYTGGSRSDNPYVNFYWDFCSQGKPGYVPIRFISLPDAIKLIKAAGGISVLAHPGNNVKEDSELLSRIAKEGICGIEAYSSYHTPIQTAFYKQKAAELHLAVSCGSDFHGKTKPAIKIGSTDCENTEAELFDRLLSIKNAE